jgi:hypothetical protein
MRAEVAASPISPSVRTTSSSPSLNEADPDTANTIANRIQENISVNPFDAETKRFR